MLTVAFGCSRGDVSGAETTTDLDSARATDGSSYTLFEAGAVRPIAVLEHGLVAVTNIPDDRIELFRPHARGVTHCGSVKVGMRPVAVAVVGEKLWVVNHLSDSVSVVDVDERRCTGDVVRTLLVGDEPRDVVSARSPRGDRYAFVTAAHRGQNVNDARGNPRDPELTTPGIGRADVFVYRADQLGPAGTERPATILTLFTDSPRALAVGKDHVYAAGFLSGNQTTLVRYQLVVDRGRQSLRRLDANGDFQIDPELPAEARVIEGGYPAISGHGRCVAATLTTPDAPGADRNDHWMDVCVRTDPADPYRALEILPQNTRQLTPACSCNNAIGELQITPPMIVQFYESPAVCGAHFSPALGGCWLEPPQNNADLPGPNATQPLLVQAWNDQVALSLPDRDVFTIDLQRNPPALVPGGDFRRVGTTLFNMAVHPKSGKIFVSNTDARNSVRFEGPGVGVAQDGGFASTTLRGHVAESRITVLDPSSRAVKPVHLNAHIDYTRCCAPSPNAETERSLAFPVGLAMSAKRDRRGQLLDAQDLYIAALGSDKVAVVSTARLEQAAAGEAIQDQRDHIEIGGGPVGLELDETRERLYVLARFTNELVVVSTRSRAVVDRHRMFSPEPAAIVEGRPFLYDARRTSSHGDTACASCHIFGDFDGLSWDLGAPDEHDVANLGPFFSRLEITPPLVSRFLAVKGPMNTQSLRGMANHGALHWRGDRRGGLDTTVHVQPDTGAFDEDAAFKAFNGAFAGLNGRATQLTSAEMQKFTNFALALTYPPNPIRRLDNELTTGQKRARSRYFGCEISDASWSRGECADGRNIDHETMVCNCANSTEFRLGVVPRPASCPPDPVCTLGVSDVQNTCNGCHLLDPDANAEHGVAKPGMFGSNGLYTNDGVAHVLKIPHLRNLYQKVGMFGSVQTRRGVGLNNLADSIFGPRSGGLLAAENAHLGEQIRGFGFTHAGEEDTMFHFFSSIGFARSPMNPDGMETTLPRDTQACYDGQLVPLNQRFLAELAPPATLEQLTQQLIELTSPASTPEQREAAFESLASFIAALPPSNPGSVLQRLPTAAAVSQLALPLLTCPALPPEATLQELGCFEIQTGFSCAALINDVRGCATWGATLEQILPNGTKACQPLGIEAKADMEDFVFAFDSNLKPVVGQQITLDATSGPRARARLQLLLAQADQGHCDLVAHTGERGFVYADGQFVRDDGTRYSVSRFEQRVIGATTVTITAVPPGEGPRSGIDRDEDGRLDALERR